MKKGFFASRTNDATPRVPLVPACGSCGLHRACASPKMPPEGEGRRKILLVGEAPSAQDDAAGRRFTGKAGRHLEAVLRDCGVDMRRDCVLTSALSCRTPAGDSPTDKQVAHCRPLVLRAIEQHRPEVIVTLGRAALRSVVGSLWRETTGELSKWVGLVMPNIKLNAWICPTWNPLFVVRDDVYGGRSAEVRELLFARHLRAAVALRGRPFEEVPDYASALRISVNPEEAVPLLRNMVMCAEQCDDFLAFDYETDRLKPDHPDADIICASVSDGLWSVAFPMTGSKIRAVWRDFLRSPVRKIAHNDKFEVRWSEAKFGVTPANLDPDPMIVAHLLDQRPGVTGLKFQAFATLGVGSYDDAVKPYMAAKGGNDRNRLREFPLPELLKYNAMDSLLTWHLRATQRKVVGF